MGRLTKAVMADRRKPGLPCKVGVALATYDNEDAVELTELLAMAKSDAPDLSITRALRADGYVLGDQAVSRHRDGRCSCGPTG